MSYLSVHIQEIESHSQKNDTSIIIIYDAEEENFYLYGNRDNKTIGNYFVPYSYIYHYTELNSLIHFIGLVMDNNNSSFTFEYNHLYIPYEDLDYVDYHYLRSKILPNNEIIAFVDCKLKKKEIKKNFEKIIFVKIKL